MDWGPVLGGLIGTVVGAVIAAGVGYWQARTQRSWSLEDFTRSLRAERDREVRARADSKAIEIVSMLGDLRDHIDRHTPIFARYLWSADTRDVGKDLLTRIRVAAAFLQEPVRTKVQLVPAVLSEVDQLVGERWIRDDARSVAHLVLMEADEALGGYLRGEAVHEVHSERVANYLTALKDMEESIELRIEAQIAEAEEEAGRES